MLNSPSNNQVIRLARLALEWHEKRRHCLEMQQQINRLKATGMVVVQGEEEFVLRLLARLNEAQRLLNEIQQAPSGKPPHSGAECSIDVLLNRLGDGLSATEWRLLEEVQATLREKIALEQEISRYYREEIEKWPLRQLQMHLADALRVSAPVRLEKAKIERWGEKINQAKRYLGEQQYEPLQERLHQLSKEFDEVPDILQRLLEKQKKAGVFFRQAELVLLRRPIEANKLDHYSVVLRTPSTARTPAMNIHDSSTVVQLDRLQFIKTINKVTNTIQGRLSGRLAGHFDRWLDDESTSLTTRGSFSQVERQTPKQLAAELRRMGELIYRLLIPEPMRSYLRDHLSSLTITTNDLELPWELMSYEDGTAQEQILCLHRPVARMPTGRALPRIKAHSTSHHASMTHHAVNNQMANFLLIYADPDNDLPEAEREVDLIKKGLQERWQGRLNIDVYKKEQVTGAKLNQILLEGEYDVIHYAGHASFNAQDPTLSGLLLHDGELFFAQKIFSLLEGRPLVFLNACQSGVTANEQHRSRLLERQNPAAGLASAFIYGGALGCIGSLWPVYDRSAAEFAIHFYNLVLEGYMIGEAMRQARHKIYDKDPNDMTWAAFILYGDPTFVLGQLNQF